MTNSATCRFISGFMAMGAIVCVYFDLTEASRPSAKLALAIVAGAAILNSWFYYRWYKEARREEQRQHPWRQILHKEDQP